MIYLDHNATSVMRPEVKEAIIEAMNLVGNPSSVHRFGKKARGLVDEVRYKLADTLGVKPDWVVFTSGGTEANHLALMGMVPSAFLVSSIEHDSILQNVKSHLCPVHEIGVDENGLIDLDELQERLAGYDAPVFTSVMLANNETGVVQPIKEVADLVHKYGGYLHCDAVQALGKIRVDFHQLGVDLLTVSAHKFGGPKGVGALIVPDNIPLQPVLLGGGQENKMRAGTENIPAIIGFGAALGHASMDLSIQSLRDDMEKMIQEISPESIIFAQNVDRLPNTSYITMPGVSHETQIMSLDLDGIAVSSGSACSSGKVAMSHVLRAMGIDEKTAETTIRISLGWNTTQEDIDGFLISWKKLFERTRDLNKGNQAVGFA